MNRRMFFGARRMGAVLVLTLALAASFASVKPTVSSAASTTDAQGDASAKKGKKEKKGWHSVLVDGTKRYYYVDKQGNRLRGWLKTGGKTFYLRKKSGYCATGIVKIRGERYYFSKRGVMKTGWKTKKGKTYYFRKKTGAAVTGLKKIGSHRYLFSAKGVMQHGWHTWQGAQYYLDEKGYAVKGLRQIDGAWYYFTPDCEMKTGLVRLDGDLYYFSKTDGKRLAQGFTPGGRYAHTDGKILTKSTVCNLLKTALGPVGTTLYVWGGGWSTNPNGPASGVDAVTMGVPGRWKQFFDSYGSGYNYRLTRYQTRDGLDCSGYVGWTLYNTFNSRSGNDGFVMLAQHMASTYASWGWGSYASAGSFSDFRAGDIMSLASGHVYITLGQCSDGSVVLLHASPPGVMISGTSTPSGNSFSEAAALSSRYMRSYFPTYYNKFSSKLGRGTSYLTNYSRMRWNLSGKCVLTDPEGLTEMSAAAVLKKLLGNA